MAQPMAQTAGIRSQHPLWDERDAVGRHAMLTEILAQVSHEALQGDTLERCCARSSTASPGGCR